MDATNDVIIGTACNYPWGDFKNYALSLCRSGFQGRKILFVRNITDAARRNLLRLGFELIDYEKKEANTVIQRFKLLADWLDAQGDIRFVIHCDVRDVIIQKDPSPWMERQTARIFGASEFILYRNEYCNPQWVEKLYGVKGTAFLANEEVVCAGTVAGTADAVRRLSRRIYESSTDRFGDDQAALNMLLRTEFKEETIIPKADEGFILTAGWWLIGNCEGNQDQRIGQRSLLRMTPPILKDGVAYPATSTEPFCMVHQYERGEAWRPLISAHYVPDFEVGPETKLDDGFKTPVRLNTKPRYAADGLTIDWFDMYGRG